MKPSQEGSSGQPTGLLPIWVQGSKRREEGVLEGVSEGVLEGVSVGVLEGVIEGVLEGG